MTDKVEFTEEEKVVIQDRIRHETVMSEFLKMFGLGCVTGKSRKDTFKYNHDNIIEYFNGVEYIINSINSGDFPELVFIKNNAFMVIIAKSISDGFNPYRYPDIIREYNDITTLSEYSVDKPTESISIMLADIVMGNRSIVSTEITNAFGIYATMFIGLYENYIKAKNIDIITDSAKVVIQ